MYKILKWFIFIFILQFFTSCVFHVKEIKYIFSKPSEVICFSKICVRQHYGINKMKQIIKKAQLKANNRKNKRDSKENKKHKKPPVKENQKSFNG